MCTTYVDCYSTFIVKFFIYLNFIHSDTAQHLYLTCGAINLLFASSFFPYFLSQSLLPLTISFDVSQNKNLQTLSCLGIAAF